MSAGDALIELLAAGDFFSGETLASRLGVSRSAVCKHIGTLRRMGLDVHAVRGKGYRLARPLELLDADRILQAVDPAARARIAGLDVFRTLSSTNSHLMEHKAPAAGQALVCLAEYQTAGRGRRGRTWIAPFGGSLCLSLSWCFDEPPPQLGALGLAAGVGMAQALQRCGFAPVSVKWPNDLMAGGAKLAGILVELQGEVDGPAKVVIGVGMNVALSPGAREAIDAIREYPVTDLCSLGYRVAFDRNAMAAALIGALVDTLRLFTDRGFAPFLAPWRSLDWLADREVEIYTGGARWIGTARGVDTEGAMILETGEGRRRFVAGEASLRQP